jgi:alpha-D-ribose 1-methylphosphonate 5-triphosphate synthase subunit PhnG
MALKIVQDITSVAISTVGIITSVGISLKSGYIRLTPNRDCHIAIGTSPVATTSSFMIAAGQTEILKEKVVRQQISGITTGTSTVITFAQNSGNPFVVGDCLTIENAYPAGINTTHNVITAVSENFNTGESTVTVNFNSAAITGVAVTGATAARSIKIAAIADASVGATGGAGVLNITEVQITSQA